MDKLKYFLEIFTRAELKYGSVDKRLAGEGWVEHWQTLIATIMSAQSRDETTIPIAETLFVKYPTLNSLAYAKYSDVLRVFRSLNYNKTKARKVIACAKTLVIHFDGKVPETIELLVTLPGVGRKTANLIITECFGKEGICVDTHVHRLANVFGFVKTKTPTETEMALREFVPREYWSRINRIFVLWGKDVVGRDKDKFLKVLDK